MRRRLAIVAAVLALLGVGAAGVAWMAISGLVEAAQLAQGRQVYGTYCASCHSADLSGQPNWQTPLPSGRLPAPPHDASGHTWHHGDADLFLIVKQGVGALAPGYESDMPAYEGALSDDRIRAVLAYIKSTWPSREREYQARLSE